MSTKTHEPAAKAAPKEAEPFPFTASINEPQTISLPAPPDYEPPPQNGKKHATEAHSHASHHSADPDELEDEIDEAIEDGDAHTTHKKGRRK